jgi:hypothetical protein
MTASLCTLLRGWRAALLLLAVACFSPARASAGCGDYVTIRDDATAPAHRVTPQTPANPPCHGPNCSGSPTREAPPLVPVVPTGHQPKELTRNPDPADGPDAEPGCSFDRDSTSARPIRQASSVYHPPRAG